MSRPLFIAAVALTVAGCVPTEGPSGTGLARADVDRPCFLPQTVVNFRADGDTTAYVRAGRAEVFEVKSGFCRGLSAARSLSVSGGLGSGGRTCVGQTVDIAVAGPSLTNENNSVCRAEVVRRLTPEEVAALPSRLRP